MNKFRTWRKKEGTAYLFMGAYLIFFTIFIVLPTFIALGLSFTDYNGISSPNFVGLDNYVYMFTQDQVFLEYVLPNTIKFALIVGPLSYFCAFILAWMLSQLPSKPRNLLALLIYSPSMVMGVAVAVVWQIIFSGDATGYLNSFLLNIGAISEPIQWLQSPEYLMGIMMIVTLWSSMGVGFLAILSGLLNVDTQLYEAAEIDGVKNRFQEIVYITIPSMKPQMLFAAVMSIVGTFTAGSIGVMLSGSNPTPQYAGQLMVNHIDDYAYIRFQMGYACAVAVVLLLIIFAISRVVFKIFKED